MLKIYLHQIITVNVGCATCTEKLTEIQKVINQFMDLKTDETTTTQQCPTSDDIQFETVFFHSTYKDIVSILVDQNFTMNAIGIVLESKRFVWKIIIRSRFCQFCHSQFLYFNDNLWPSR